jgi:hypothetical protein
MKYIVCILFLSVCFAGKTQTHPYLYVSGGERQNLLDKIEREDWAKQAWLRLLNEINPYVEKCREDSEWLVSRLAMYWKEGERYTQCYLKKQNWDYGTGNAPVPTLRMPGMRTWNEYGNVPLEKRTSYNETGDMWGISRKNPDLPPVLVPYKKSGHMIRGNNREILDIAAKMAFAYFITKDEDYARAAAHVYQTWLLGVYYMNPILDSERSTGSSGGYEPGGICGYYDYEQIHDDLAMTAAPIYDFLYNYLNEHPDPFLKETDKTLIELSGTVFKRFIDIGMIRGGKSGNWNINGWNMMILPILILENDDFYPDKKGRNYYLQYYVHKSTPYHDALPDILNSYDSVTGLWPESPGYAFGTINVLISLALPLYKTGINTIQNNPVMQKAALAIFPWLDARGNTVVFGDSRGGQANYSTFERLLTYYTWTGDEKNAAIVTSAIQRGIDNGEYNREKCGWEDIILNIPRITENKAAVKTERMAYSPFHRHITLKNGNDKQTALMATLYGGRKDGHMSPNGLAMQLYGIGWALAPDASGYESYWSADHVYHQSVTGSNTIVPGYAEGEIRINAMEPVVPATSFVNTDEISSDYSFADVSAGEKRRLLSIIRTSETSGYYIDIFRSNQENNDYIFHNLGNSLTLSDNTNNVFDLQAVNDLGNDYGRGYDYFKSQRKLNHAGDFKACWQIDATPVIMMEMWMMGQNNRSLYQVDAPYSNLNKSISPNSVSIAPYPTPTLIVRQNGLNAWKHPFVAIFEPYGTGNKTIHKIQTVVQDEGFICLSVESVNGRKDIICNAVDGQTHTPQENMNFKGIFGIITQYNEQVRSLYLGRGYMLEKDGIRIESDTPVSAAIRYEDGHWRYSSDGIIKVTIQNKTIILPVGYDSIIKM